MEDVQYLYLDLQNVGSSVLATHSLINHEITSINNLIQLNIEPQLKLALKKQLQALYKNSQTLLDLTKSNQMNFKLYQAFLENTKKQLLAKKEEVKQIGEDSLIRLMEERIAILENEIKLMKSPNAFLQLTQNALNLQQEVKKQKVDFDHFSPLQKLIELKKRHKMYHNLATYYINNMQEEKQQIIQEKLMPLLQKSQMLKQQLENEQNVPINDFLKNEFVEISGVNFSGMTPQTRLKQIKEILNLVEQCKLQEKNYQKIASHSIYTKEQNVESAKQSLVYDQNIDQLKQIINDLWIPLPKFKTFQIQRPIKIENRDLDLNILKIQFKQLLNAPSDSYYIIYQLRIDDQIIKDQTPQVNQQNQFNYVKNIETTNNRKVENKNIHQTYIDLSLYRKKWIGSADCGVAQIKLANFQFNNKIEGVVEFRQNGKVEGQLEYILQIRQPTKENLQQNIQNIIFERFYPKFDVNEGVLDYIKADLQKQQQNQSQNFQVNNSNFSQNQFQNQYQNNNIPPQNQQSGNHQNNQTPQQIQQVQNVDQNYQSKQPKDLATIVIGHNEQINQYITQQLQNSQIQEGLTLDDILNPENPEKAPCLSFIEAMVNVFEQAKSNFRDKRMWKEGKHAQAMYEEYDKQQMIINHKVNQGELDPQAYLADLEKAKEKDKKLLNIYRSLNLPKEWPEFVQTRISYINNEIEDFHKNMEEE